MAALAPDQFTRDCNFRGLTDIASVEPLAGRRAPEAQNLPTDIRAACRKVDRGLHNGCRLVEHDGFRRQPFEGRAGGHAHAHSLGCRGIARSVPLACAGQRDQHLCPCLQSDANLKLVAPRDASWRMQDQRMAHFRPFGIKRLLYYERSGV